VKGLRLTGLLGLLAFGNLVISFAYHWYIVTRMGAGEATDALVAAMVLPQLVLAVFSGSLTQVLVPLLSNMEELDFRHASWGFAFGMGGLFALLSLLLTGMASVWVPWVVPGFGPQLVGLTVKLAMIQLAGMVFIALAAVLMAVNHARQKFVWAEASGLFSSLVSLAFLLWALPEYGIVAGAWGLFLRPLVQFFLLAPVLGSLCWPVWQRVPWQEAWRRLRPLLVGTVYYKTDPMVDRILTSLAIPGSMTLLNLSQQLYGAGAGVLGKAVAAPMIPEQAKAAARGDWASFRDVLKRRLALCTLLTVGGWLSILAVGQQMLPWLFANRLSLEDVHQLWWLLVLLGGMWLGGGIGSVSSGAFYATGDTRTPTRLGIISYTVYVPIKILVFWKFGIAGLALSISGFYLVNLFLQLYYLKIPGFGRTLYAGR